MTPGTARSGRRAGLLLPLFSCPSSRSWGIGEFADLPLIADWMRKAGLRVLQVLPLNEVTPGQHSPYSAASSMALDPIFISLWAVPDFQANGGEDTLELGTRAAITRARMNPTVAYGLVRAIKERALRLAFQRFVRDEWPRNSGRAAEFRNFVEQQRAWLEEFALFSALRYANGGRPWREWPEAVRDREGSALAQARQELADEIRYRQYLQWIAHGQWQEARSAAPDVRVFGDFPFAVAADSADVWINQDLFSFDGTAGAPPDAFSEDGQNWQLPVYRWDVMRDRGYDYFRKRARRIGDLFDGFRVDHVVGLFRTWVFPGDGSAPRFVPAAEPEQIAQGRAVLKAVLDTSAEVVAEDLGTIPSFVREELSTLGIPGYKVLRWEREWKVPGCPFKDPASYPPESLATSGTHDTETLAAWWEGLSEDDRQHVLAIPGVRERVQDASGVADPLRAIDALLEALFASGSDLLVLPIQDLFGWIDRINVPALIDDRNWTWKMPWAIDRIEQNPEAAERLALARRWSTRYGRL